MDLVNQQDLTVDNGRIRQAKELPYNILKEMGWEWFSGEDDWRYLAPEMIAVAREEIIGYRQACDQLYKLYLDAAEYVISNNLFDELNIPPNMIEMIKLTWASDSHQHLIGRFDLAGGMDGLPIKLIEFNADTPTTLAETAFIQREMLKINDISEDSQFNIVFEELVDYLKKILILNPHKKPTLLVSTLGFDEDVINADVIFDAAEEAGFDVEYRDLADVSFSEDEGIFVELENEEFMKFDFWFKLVPWEFISLEEPELMDILNNIVKEDLAIILNPAYTILFQSKGMLKVLWDLNPGHSLLLETTSKKPDNPSAPYVEKVVFGREGENICIYGSDGEILDEREGDYFEFPVVYQDFAKLPCDDSGNYYQPGIFYVAESCALSFRRRNSLIVDEDAKFVAHFSID